MPWVSHGDARRDAAAWFSGLGEPPFIVPSSLDPFLLVASFSLIEAGPLLVDFTGLLLLGLTGISTLGLWHSPCSGLSREERYTAKVLALVALYRRAGAPTPAASRLRQEKQVGVVQELDLHPYLIWKVYLSRQ